MVTRSARQPLWEHRPEIFAELDFGKHTPDVLKALGTGSQTIVWWLCPNGHSYEAKPSARCSGGLQCPFCSGLLPIVGENDLATLFPDIAREFIGLESGTHTPTSLTPGSSRRAQWRCSANPNHLFKAKIYDRTTSGVGCPFCNKRKLLVGDNDLATTHPDLSQQWDVIANRNGTPSSVMSNSRLKAHWVCDRNPEHRWAASIFTRANGTGCPYCLNQAVLAGHNDLEFSRPEIALLWHKTMNGDLLPSHVVPGSSKKVWWQCAVGPGHEWRRNVTTMTKVNSNCPFCSGRRVLKGFNNFSKDFPGLMKEWDHAENSNLDPNQISRGSKVKAAWKCKNYPEHKWSASIGSRVRGNGCPYCAGRQVLEGFNDLLSQNPGLGEQWDMSKNSPVTPTQVTSSAHLRAWWTCSADESHSWQATVASRNSGNGCPLCSNQITVNGVNDLSEVFPALFLELVPELNPGKRLDNINPGNRRNYWWRCPVNSKHTWKASPSNRTRHGSGCPYCANLAVFPGDNDLATQNPKLASEWDFTKNGTLTPSEIVAGSGRKIWWLCVNDAEHSWQSSVKNRALGRGCNTCATVGFQASQPALIYFIQNTTLLARKVGITNQNAKLDRLLAFSKQGWEVVFTLSNDNGYIPMGTETLTLRWIRKDLLLPPFLSKDQMPRVGGWSETFSIYGPTNQEVIDAIKEFEIEATRNFNATL